MPLPRPSPPERTARRPGTSEGDPAAACEPRRRRRRTAVHPRRPMAHAASARQPGTPPEPDSPSTVPLPPRHRQVPQRRTDPDPRVDRAIRRCPGEPPSGHLLCHTCRPTFLIMRCPLLRAPRIWPGNTKAVSPGCLGVTAWRRRCDLHRRTTGGWSQTGRELGIGDVVIAESGDTCALHVGCRNAALKAELSPSAPAGDRLDAMIMSRATERDACNGWHSRHERARRQMEFGHATPSGDWAADPQDMHQPLLSLVQAGDGRPCAQGRAKGPRQP
jgi:hypothetical protein